MANTEKAEILIQQIKEGVAKVRNSADWTAWLDAESKFYQYSFGNQMLILLQRPTASRVMGFQGWKNNFGRQVKKGEKAIQILAPMVSKRKAEDKDGNEKEVRALYGFRVATVFDISQTEGPEIPEVCHKLKGAAPAGLRANLEAVARNNGFTVEYRPLRGDMGGFVNHRKEIVINSINDEAHQVSVLLHEMAHGLLGHPQDKELSRAEKELQAESAAWTACRVLGIDASPESFGYLASWAEATALSDALERAGMVAQRVAKQILEQLEALKVEAIA